MSIELPVLHLGLVGFTAEQQALIERLLANPAAGGMVWAVSKFGEADAWWVNGARTQVLPDGNLRIASGVPSGRAVQLSLSDVDRPIAYSLPLAPRDFTPTYKFTLESEASVHAVLNKFESWLRPLTAQFCLASQIIENESALTSGVYHVMGAGRLLAVVNMQGEAGVLPIVGPGEFEDATWNARPAAASAIPDSFVRSSLSQLMWQYAVRTSRNVLPKRYLAGQIYFRRPPRLPQRLLTDTHLLLLRELAMAPASFEELQQRTGLSATPLMHGLAALYLVGSITSNPKRAGASARVQRRPEDPDSLDGLAHSMMPSGGLDSQPNSMPPRAPKPSDMTAPAPLSLE